MSKPVTYMLFDTDSCNAVGSYDTLAEARKALQEQVDEYPECRDEIVIFGVDARGHAVGEVIRL